MLFEIICGRSRGAGLVRAIAALMLVASFYCRAQPSPASDLEKAAANIGRLSAEIAQRATCPFKVYITPSTTSVAHAFYFKHLQKRMENIGNENFPVKEGKSLYGKMVVSIPIYQDGTLFMRDGGARVEKSSGNVDLDNAALELIRSAAPFDPISKSTDSRCNDEVWIIIANFSFTRQASKKVDALSKQRRSGTVVR